MYFSYSAPHLVYVPHPFSKWSTRPISHSLYPGYESGLRTRVQHLFSFELACCSNSIPHSNKLYFPLILSHVWKFFSNPSPDHKKCYYPIQFSSVAQSCPTLCDLMIAAPQASLSVTNSRSLLKLMSIKSVMPSSHLILCRPLLLLPPVPPSIRVFSSESTLGMRWPKYCSYSISPSSEHPGLISFRIDWLDFLAVQGTLKSLLQHYSSKAIIFRCSAFCTVQLSHPYMTSGKAVALTRWTFVGKVMSLLFNMLSKLVITFLPRTKCLFIYYPIRPTKICKTKLQRNYEFLLYYSVALCFKIVIHRAEFSTLLTQITLLKMWYSGPTSELLSQNTLKKNVFCFFDKQFILCHMSRTLKNKYANITLMILWFLF